MKDVRQLFEEHMEDLNEVKSKFFFIKKIKLNLEIYTKYESVGIGIQIKKI